MKSPAMQAVMVFTENLERIARKENEKLIKEYKAELKRYEIAAKAAKKGNKSGALSDMGADATAEKTYAQTLYVRRYDL